MRKIQTAFVLVILVFSACQKYEEGPSFSFHSKKKRISNSWIIDKVFETPQGGTKTDKTTDYWNYYVDYNLIIDEGGNYSLSFRPLFVTTYNENGTWHFNGQKTNVIFVNGNGNPSSIGSDWTILRLKQKELWMQTINNNNVTVEAHLIPLFR